jgi:hypothetical protein
MKSQRGEGQIAATDTQIDRLVYKLYLTARPSRQAVGLAEDEIKMAGSAA